MNPIRFERVHTTKYRDAAVETRAAKVEGGTLYQSVVVANHPGTAIAHPVSVAMVFVPTPPQAPNPHVNKCHFHGFTCSDKTLREQGCGGCGERPTEICKDCGGTGLPGNEPPRNGEGFCPVCTGRGVV